MSEESISAGQLLIVRSEQNHRKVGGFLVTVEDVAVARLTIEQIKSAALLIEAGELRG